MGATPVAWSSSYIVKQRSPESTPELRLDPSNRSNASVHETRKTCLSPPLDVWCVAVVESRYRRLHALDCIAANPFQCDERSGGCMRCERYGIDCPGYQDPFDVLLRHQDNGKVTSDDQTSVREFGRDREHPVPLSTQVPGFTTMSRPFLMRQPTLDIDQLALGAYYSAYCVSSSTLVSLEHLRKQGNGCLWAAIKMLGMIQLYQERQWTCGGSPLLKQYSEATALLNEALYSPLELREDRTLLATLMLSVVEMKQSPDFTLHYWLMHMTGAAALMNLRGADQILSRLGAALYLQISSQIVIYSILGQKPIPQALQDLRAKIQPYVMVNGHPLWDWHGLMYRFADFWANAPDTSKSDDLVHVDAESIILEALSIHNDMELIFQKAGIYWQYSTQAGDGFLPLINHEHIYHSLLTARIWNDRRVATILLFTVIARIAGPGSVEMPLKLDAKYDSHYLKAYAYETIQETAKETLAAVPQTLAGLKGKVFEIRQQSSLIFNSIDVQGLRLCESSSEYDEHVFNQRQAHQNLRSSATLPYMDTCRVQWAVYFAVQCEFVHPLIRSHLLQVLETSGKILQMQQWQILAEKVRNMIPDL